MGKNPPGQHCAPKPPRHGRVALDRFWELAARAIGVLLLLGFILATVHDCTPLLGQQGNAPTRCREQVEGASIDAAGERGVLFTDREMARLWAACMTDARWDCDMTTLACEGVDNPFD